MANTTIAAMNVIQRELLPREPATYDMRTGLYVVARRWKVHEYDWIAALSLSDIIMAGLVPASFVITHTDGVTRVDMIPVTRHTERLESILGADTYLTVTYEGHACLRPLSGSPTTTSGAGAEFNGVVGSHYEFGTKSEQVIVSFDLDALGNRKGIGPNGEGTNRLVPNTRMTIVQNVTQADFYNRFGVMATLVGLVNEELWADPVTKIFGIPFQWDEGIWLYLGAGIAQNRDGTFTLQHQFEFDVHPLPPSLTTTVGAGVGYYRHKFLWYFLSEEKQNIGGIQKIVKRATGPPQLSTIYQTAGPGVGLGHTFADLFRAIESFP